MSTENTDPTLDTKPQEPELTMVSNNAAIIAGIDASLANKKEGVTIASNLQDL